MKKSSLLLLLFILLFSMVHAQSGAPDVNVLGVNDSAYPELDVYLSVMDSERQAAIPGLMAENFFGDTDNGQPMEVIEAVQERRPLNVVVVLDVTGSVSQQELDNQRLAVAELIRILSPGDSLGVVVMNESSAQVVAPLQNNYDEILRLMNGIQIREDATGNAFWDGIYGALVMLQSADMRRVVVVLTDVSPSGGEGIRTQDEVLTLAVENHVEIYGLYFEYEGDGIPDEPPVLPPELTILSEATGGFTQGVAADLINRGEDYTDDQALAPMMENIASALQFLYRVRFKAPLPADGTTHHFTVRVDLNGVLTPPVTGTFQAGENTILITFPELSANQEISLPATINFRVQPREGQIQSVKVVAINSAGDELELPTTDEYTVNLQWGQFSPGQLTLRVVAEDAAGNQQEVSLPLNIIDRLSVDWQSPPPDTIQQGEEITLKASIGFAASVQQVEFLVNDDVVDVRDFGQMETVEFTWEAADAGEYTLEIAAQDIQGQRASAEASITVEGKSASSGLSREFLILMGIVFLGGIALVSAGIRVLRRRPAVTPAPVSPTNQPPTSVVARQYPQMPVNAELEGPNGEHWRLVEGQNTLGRHSSNHIQILDESVSRHHAVIEVVNNRCYYMDLPTASHPGEINGNLVKPEQRYELRDGNLIRIGSTLIRFTRLNDRS